MDPTWNNPRLTFLLGIYTRVPWLTHISPTFRGKRSNFLVLAFYSVAKYHLSFTRHESQTLGDTNKALQGSLFKTSLTAFEVRTKYQVFPTMTLGVLETWWCSQNFFLQNFIFIANSLLLKMKDDPGLKELCGKSMDIFIINFAWDINTKLGIQECLVHYILPWCFIKNFNFNIL